MAVARVKNWVDREVLTHSALNTEFNNIVDNGEDLAWPATKAKDFNGLQLTLDADGDSFISATTDDVIVFNTGGSEAMRIDATQTLLVGTTTTSEAATVKLAIGSTDTGTVLRIQSTNNTSVAGPIITMDRDSSSPAASDELAKLHFNGRESTDVTISYVQIGAIIRDPTTVQPDGVFVIEAMEDGILKKLQWGPNTADEGASIFIENTAPQPTTNPVGGGILYCLAGALRYRGTSGTDTEIAVV